MQTFSAGNFYYLLQGLKWTVMLSLIGFAGGGIGGILIALARTSGNRLLSFVAAVFIEFFQGTPLLMQLFIVYFGMSLLNVEVNAWIAVAIGLTLNSSAFLGEIWRGGIQAIPRGQTEAAKALGLRYFSRMRDVVFPQAWRISLPSTVGFAVQLIKGTSLASIVGFTELARAGQVVSNATFQPMLVFGVVGALYFAICWPLSELSARLERRGDAQRRKTSRQSAGPSTRSGLFSLRRDARPNS
ncbi:amino acid ABC transporter permease [Paraburkholderia sp. GAS199]|uniref:amino acid ABC transporter permease n=1 Tax=Paraburkholderia sp. GAS199 TaxID=3035126 RepID=UPI003D2482D1